MMGILAKFLAKMFLSRMYVPSDWPSLIQFISASSHERFKNADKETVEEIVSFLNHPNVTIQRGAFVFVNNLAHGGTIDQVQMLLECSIFEIFIKRLGQEQDATTKVLIIKTLNALVNEKTEMDFVDSNLMQNLVKMDDSNHICEVPGIASVFQKVCIKT